MAKTQAGEGRKANVDAPEVWQLFVGRRRLHQQLPKTLAVTLRCPRATLMSIKPEPR